MKPCHECAYRRCSERGFTSHVEENKGTFKSAINSAVCHNAIICHTKGNRMCRGSILYLENSFKKGQHKEVFDNPEEFLKHHAVKEDPSTLLDKYQDHLSKNYSVSISIGEKKEMA